VPGYGVEGQALLDLASRKRKAVRNDAHLAKVAIVRESARKAGIVKRNARVRGKK
jgi:hypothetical protein